MPCKFGSVDASTIDQSMVDLSRKLCGQLVSFCHVHVIGLWNETDCRIYAEDDVSLLFIFFFLYFGMNLLSNDFFVFGLVNSLQY